MKKILFVAMLTFVLIFSLSACGEDKESPQDANFISSVADGLQARWSYQADNENNDAVDEKEYFTESVTRELNEVKEYENAIFKDSKLKEKALNYINTLKDQLAALEYITADSERYDEEWGKAYDERTKLIKDFTDNYDLVVDDKYSENIKELLTNATTVEEDESKQAEVDKIVKNIKFKKTEDEYGYKTYQATVENTSNMDFSYFNINVNLIDKDKVVIEKQTAYTDDFQQGAKARFEFSTEEEFKDYKITSVDWEEKK